MEINKNYIEQIGYTPSGEVAEYLEKLMHKIKDFPIMSFDVYDTLIKRDVQRPEDIFLCVQKEYNTTHKKKIFLFCKIRKLAARFAYKFSHAEEINIDHIYKFMLYSQSKKNELKALELKYEEQLTVCNLPFYDIIKYCQSTGKKVYAISDMYLPQELITKVLNKCGYKVDGVYVSSNHGVTKVSGKLFQVFMDDLHLEASEILHIGDSQIGDIDGATKAGINSFKIPTRIENTHYFNFQHSDQDVNFSVMKAFINNRMMMGSDRFEQIGYEVLGPFLYEFCIWLHEKAKKNNVRKIFFFARDALLNMEIYKAIYGDEAIECEYFYVSRKSLLIPYKFSAGINKDAESEEQYNILKDYMESIGFFDSGDIAVVDDGGYCRPQFMLTQLLKSFGAKCQYNSFNFELNRGYRKFLNEKKCYSYLFEGKYSSTKMIVSNGFFETLISAVHGSTYSYQRSGNATQPVFGPTNEHAEGITKIQRGALRFAEEWSSFDFSKQSIGPDKIIVPFFTLALNPRTQDVELIENFEKSDADSIFIIDRGRQYYSEHPLDWLRDFQKSNWKGGFLKKYFSNTVFICQAYIFLDAIRLYIWKPKIHLEDK